MSYPPQHPEPYASSPPPQSYPPPPMHDSNTKSSYGSGNPQQYPPNYDPNDTAISPQTSNNRFQPPTGPQDLWATILFGAQFLAFLALAGISIPKFDFTRFGRKPDSVPEASPQNPRPVSSNANQGLTFNSYAIVAMVGSAIIALLLSIGYLFAMRKYPKQLIKYTFWISIALSFILGILAIVRGNIVGGGVMIIIGVMYIVFYRAYKSRMPFASLILETVSDVTIKYPGTVTACIIGLFVQLGYVALWGVTMISSITVFEAFRENSGKGVLSILIIFLSFSFYWTTQVIKNLVHVTVSGVFATYYFLSGTSQGMPTSPTSVSFKRAMTTSFGSVAYGSLLIAIIQTLRSIVRSSVQQSDSIIGAILACCLDCILSWIESLAEIFNKYAFTQVAIYGKDFCRAAKDTWTLIKDRGIDALINDNLIDNVIVFGALLVAVISANIGLGIYSIGKAAAGDLSSDSALFIIILVAFVGGVVMFSLIASVILSGVATTFVCLAEDPAALRASKPELYQRVLLTYPDVQISMYS